MMLMVLVGVVLMLPKLVSSSFDFFPFFLFFFLFQDPRTGASPEEACRSECSLQSTQPLHSKASSDLGALPQQQLLLWLQDERFDATLDNFLSPILVQAVLQNLCALLHF